MEIKGWVQVNTWKFDLGISAVKVEKEIMRLLRKGKNLKSFLQKKQMPITGGHIETIEANLITLRELEEIVDRVILNFK